MAKQKLIIDLTKHAEVADLVATMEPGDTVILETSIQAKDEQTLTLSLISATSSSGDEAEVDDPDMKEASTGATDMEDDDEDDEVGAGAKPSRSLTPDL